MTSDNLFDFGNLHGFSLKCLKHARSDIKIVPSEKIAKIFIFEIK